MKKMVLVGAVLAMAAAACGDVADEPGAATTTEVTELASGTVTSTTAAPADDTVADSTSPASSVPAQGDLELEVTPVDPKEGGDKDGVQPPPTTAGDAVVPIEVDHPNPQVATAIGDLAARFGIDVSAVEVVSLEEVTWPDGSIGCPLPGMRYTQALVNGSRLILQAGGIQYQYNSGGGRDLFYCADPSDPVAGEGDYGDI